MSVSKEQKRLRNFEMGMLSAYQVRVARAARRARGGGGVAHLGVAPQRFLQQLERKARACDSEDPVSMSLAQTSVKCMCQLLRKASYFNFRSNLIQAIVQRMGAKEDFARRLACSAISTLFAEVGSPLPVLWRAVQRWAVASLLLTPLPLPLRAAVTRQDRPSEASMEAAQKIHDLVKARRGRVDLEALETCAAREKADHTRCSPLTAFPAPCHCVVQVSLPSPADGAEGKYHAADARVEEGEALQVQEATQGDAGRGGGYDMAHACAATPTHARVSWGGGRADGAYLRPTVLSADTVDEEIKESQAHLDPVVQKAFQVPGPSPAASCCPLPPLMWPPPRPHRRTGRHASPGLPHLLPRPQAGSQVARGARGNGGAGALWAPHQRRRRARPPRAPPRPGDQGCAPPRRRLALRAGRRCDHDGERAPRGGGGDAPRR